MDGPIQVELDPQPFDRLESVIGADAFGHLRDAMRTTAARLNGNTIWSINSTAEGGGVAEMLSTQLPYCLSAGWDVRWVVISGSSNFFELTKDIHNALHGASAMEETRDPDDRRLYCEITDANAAELCAMVRPGDVALVHDPQTAGLITPLAKSGVHASWQCHVGTDNPNNATKRAWDFLRPFVSDAERYVFSREEYLWDGLERERLRVIPPAIDVLSAKNAPMNDAERDSALTTAGILDGTVQTTLGIRDRVQRVGGEARVPSDARIVLEVSRWDRLKDPIGFIRMADELTDVDGVHIIYAGPSTDGVDDDPEGANVLIAAEELWRSLAPDVRERVHLLSIPMEDIDENAVIVNALQRRADVTVQKSIEEGFGLTVSEAMWKRKPVVASRVGGIQDQIEHGRSGILIDDPYDVSAFADAVRSLLDDPARSSDLGEAAHRRVRDRFLGHRMLVQYAELIRELAA